MADAKKIIEKRQELAGLVKDVRAIMDKAETEKREKNQEEKNSISEMEARIDKLDQEIDLETRQLERERKFGEEHETPPVDGENRDKPKDDKTKEYRSAFTKYLENGEKAGFVYTDGERRAIQVENQAAGGLFQAPRQFVTELIQEADNAMVIAGLATVFNINNAEGLGAVSMDTDVDDFDWTPEIKAATETTDPKFGGRELKPSQLTKLAKISNALLGNNATMSMDQLVQQRLGYKVGVTCEKVYMTGHGSQQPLGLFAASNIGIGTDYDITGVNTTTDIKGDTLWDALFDLSDQDRAVSTWLFHRTAIRNLRKLKDSSGNYIWVPGFNQGISGGVPSTICDRPYVTSEYCPHTFTASQYVGMIANFKQYWIARRYDIAIQVLKELYALTNQTGYIGRLQIDAMPVRASAFRRIKLAA